MFNECFVEGILTGEPILATTEKGRSACTFVMAVYRDGYGQGIDFVKCKAYGKVADILCIKRRKGDHFLVAGAVRDTKYENYKGQDVRELILHVRFVKFLPKEPVAKYADDFFERYPEIKKLYNQYVKDEKKAYEPENEPAEGAAYKDQENGPDTEPETENGGE
jgi:single-stranded DNA-binding protein